VPEKVTISYRGAHYQIGRGKHFYGIWTAGEPAAQPVAWWPETAEGWSGAWSRFTAMEPPGSVVRVGQRTDPPPAASRAVIIAAALLGAGVLAGLIGLFPAYVGGTSLAGQAYELVPHVIYLAAWAASAAGILRGRGRLQAGALLGVGVSVLTFGLFLADLGQVIAGQSAGAGLVLTLLGWLGCAAGSVMAFRLAAVGRPARPLRRELGHVAMVVIAGFGAACAFAPSWDSYVLRLGATGATYSVTEGNAFAFPGAVIAGNVIVMVGLVAVVAVAALWRPIRHGAALLAGATIALAAQAISALVLQLGQGATAAQFGFTPQQAGQAGLTISSGFTPVFWVYCVFVVALAASCAWMFLTPDPPATPPQAAHPWNAAPGATSSGTASAGPALSGPVVNGPVVDGPVVDGPVATGALLAPAQQASDDADDEDWEDDEDDDEDTEDSQNHD
jgi:hypothetical protein